MKAECPDCSVELRDATKCPCGWKAQTKTAPFDNSYYTNCRKNRSTREYAQKHIDKMKSIIRGD